MMHQEKTILRNTLLLLALFLISVALQMLVAGKVWGSGQAVVWVFNVGQGDAIFIDGPDRQVLIDGGPNATILEKLGAVMPFWDRDIDFMINTHPHADHVTGLVHVMERYAIGQAFGSGQHYDSEIFTIFQQQAYDRSVRSGEVIDLGRGMTLRILWPSELTSEGVLKDPNEGSVVALLSNGEHSVLFTGDIGTETEELLLAQFPDVDVLKVAHQGSLTSTSPEFLSRVKPEYAIISVGENGYGHPSPIVLDRLQMAGSQIFRTDMDGDIRIELKKSGIFVTQFDL